MSDDPFPSDHVEPPPIDPAIPPVVPVVPVPELTPPATTSGLPSNIGAALSIFFLLVGGVVFLLVEKKDSLTKFWAMQSIILGAVWLVVRLAFLMVGAILYHIFLPLSLLWWLLATLVNLGFLAVWIICIYQAFNGKRWEIPFLGRIAREQLARLGPRS